MALGKYSDSLKQYTGIIQNRELTHTIEALKRIGTHTTVRKYRWDDNRIAVGIDIGVDLPPLGTAGGVDIQRMEPILLVFDPKLYPHKAPLVFPDRIDFPSSQLPHLYVARPGKPPAFCLTRGGVEGLDEWYANRRIEDVLIRTQNWLRDAGTGELVTDAAQFDPIRLEGYIGSFTYNYQTLFGIVNKRESFEVGGNFARISWRNYAKDADVEVDLWFSRLLTAENSTGSSAEENGNTDGNLKDNRLPGFLVWSDDKTPVDIYQTTLPTNWLQFQHFCKEHRIELSGLNKAMVLSRDITVEKIPITVAILRPKPIIGFPGALEFINFVVAIGKDESVSDATPVYFSRHVQILVPSKAKEISGYSVDITSLALIVGLGALGSRVALHLLKSGTINLVVCDHDRFLAHNFVRHPLSARHVHVNKAVAFEREATALYPGQTVLGLSRKVDVSLLQFRKDKKGGWEWIMDFTASLTFFNELTTTNLKHSVRVCRGLISDKGNLGLLYFEGPSRNPRIDDLQALLYDAAMTNSVISSWLQRESRATEKTETVVTGIGCNSETVIMSDDVVALHGAVISGLFKGQAKEKSAKGGRVYFNKLDFDPYFHNEVSSLTFRPVEVFSSRNKSDWQVRFAAGILDELRQKMGDASPHEIGGVLVGCANHKTKTIHVTRSLPAPPDSRADANCFFRGTEGLPETIAEINACTGGQLGYIGEWHSHPRGPNDMSTTDAATTKAFLQQYRELNPPLPVFLLIITPTSVLPFVYT